MAQPKGQTGNPNGRPKGSPNKATTKSREAIADFVNGNVDRLNGWLDDIATGGADESKANPAEAFKLFMSVIEYNLPKLQRQELVGDANNPLDITVNITDTDAEIIKRYNKQTKTKEPKE